VIAATGAPAGTKVELLINLKTVKALGITVPLSLSGRADRMNRLLARQRQYQ
jgi:hypothetical protein